MSHWTWLFFSKLIILRVLLTHLYIYTVGYMVFYIIPVQLYPNEKNSSIPFLKRGERFCLIAIYQLLKGYICESTHDQYLLRWVFSRPTVSTDKELINAPLSNILITQGSYRI